MSEFKAIYTNRYDDIINLPHYVSKKHPRLSMEQRAAQFAPFAALTGYEDAVNETARLTSDRIEIDDELKNILDSKIKLLDERVKDRPEIAITYFVHDLKKDGGEYKTVKGIVKKINTYNQLIYLEDNTEIPIKEIVDISGKIFLFNDIDI